MASVKPQNTKIDLVDIYVSNKLKYFRKLRNISQQELAEIAGVSVQQYQKYEKGNNRMSCGKFYVLATHLNIPLSCFFEGMEKDDIGFTLYEEQTEFQNNDLKEKEAFKLLKTFSLINNNDLRKCLLELIKIIAVKTESE